MKEEKQERLFRALGGVGIDLIDMAEKRTFAPVWRKWGALAACLALVLCLGVLAMPYFPMGCGSSKSGSTADTSAAETVQDSTAETAVEEAPAVAEEPAEAGGESKPWVRLVFEDTVYRVEETYSKAEAEALLGEYLGTVEESDEEPWTGCKVYGVRTEDAGPSDAILVETEDGYLYCVP